MSTQLSAPPASPAGTRSHRPPPRRTALWSVLAAAVVLLIATVAYVVVDRDDITGTAPRVTVPTAAAPTVASTTPRTTPASVPNATDTSTAVWPWAESQVRYRDPQGAARGFAVDFLRFRDPVIGPFQAGDSRSGEVGVRATANGAVTTVLVRQLGPDDSWWVLGAVTDNIRIATPAALDTIASPVHLTGTSTAFEATVGVLVWEDGAQDPLAQTTVMGGSMGDFGPFVADVSFPQPHAGAGSIVLFTKSMENGQVWEASVIRVHFAS